MQPLILYFLKSAEPSIHKGLGRYIINILKMFFRGGKLAIEAQQGAVVPFGDALIYSGLGYLMLFEHASAKQD